MLRTVFFGAASSKPKAISKVMAEHQQIASVAVPIVSVIVEQRTKANVQPANAQTARNRVGRAREQEPVGWRHEKARSKAGLIITPGCSL